MKCSTCNLMTGWGGSGAFSDGKLTLTTQVGGLLADVRGQTEADQLVQEVDRLWVRFGANGTPYSGDQDRIEEVARRAALAGLHLQHYPIRHLGTERSGAILQAMYDELVSRGVEIRTRADVAHITTKDGVVTGVETTKGEVLTAHYVVVAPGREGADWLSQLAGDLKLSLSVNPVDIGVRVELPAHVLASLTDLLYEPKFALLFRCLRRPGPHLLCLPLWRGRHRVGRRRHDGQRPFLRLEADGEHQLCTAGQQELYRAVQGADRLRQVHRASRPTCCRAASSSSAWATCARAGAPPISASSAASRARPCARPRPATWRWCCRIATWSTSSR